MKFFKKLFCMLTALAMVSSTLVFAEEDVTYIDSSKIETFTIEKDSFELMSQAPEITEQDVALTEYLISEMTLRSESISIPAQYSVSAEKFAYLQQAYIPAYITTYYPELFYVDTESIQTEETDGYVTAVSLSYNAPVTEDEIRFINDIIGGMSRLEAKFTLNAADYGISEAKRIAYLIQKCLGYCMQFDYSEMFYVDIMSTKFSVSNRLDVSVIPAYMSATDTAITLAALRIDVKNVNGLIDPDMTAEQKVLVVHDYIAANYEYDHSFKSRTLDDMVILKKGVCQGYSYLFKYLTESIGIECVNIASNAHSHMWNKVKIDGEWYNVDVTHDDPNMSSQISHSHFLLSDSEMMALEDNSHIRWNNFKWDGVTPTEAGISEQYSGYIVHEVSGPTVCVDEHFYCFDNDNNIAEINFSENSLDKLYEESSQYMWKPYGVSNQRYGECYSTLVSYRGSIYFNSPNKVYRFSRKDNTATAIYEYTDIPDVSETYLYGMTVKNNTLYAEYAAAPSNVPTFIQINIKNVETPTPTPLPYSSKTEMNMETGEVTVHLSIPEEVPEAEDVKVFIAEYDEEGTLIGVFERETNTNDLTFTPNDESDSIKTFIWSKDGSPLSVAELFNLYR